MLCAPVRSTDFWQSGISERSPTSLLLEKLIDATCIALSQFFDMSQVVIDIPKVNCNLVIETRVLSRNFERSAENVKK